MVRVPVARRSRSPWMEMDRLAREFDGLFTGTSDLWNPPVDVEETPDHLLVRAELPGMRREDIDLELEDGILTISGEKKEMERPENAQVLLFERRWGTFSRRFTLPRAVDAAGITAEYTDGVLTVRIPKAEEAKGRKIEIGDGSRTGREVGAG